MPGFPGRPYVPPKGGQSTGTTLQIYPPRPNGDPAGIRAGAPAWANVADEMAAITRDIDSALANVTWKQGGRQALDKAWNQVKGGLSKGEKDYRDFAGQLTDIANKIEQGQTAWDLGLAAIIATTAIGIGLTIFTFGASDAAAAAIVASTVVAMDGALTLVAGAIGVSVEVLVTIIETALQLAIQFLIDFAINYTLSGISSLITTGKWSVDLGQVLLATTVQMVAAPITSRLTGLISTDGFTALQLAAFRFAVGAATGLTFDLALQGVETILDPSHTFNLTEVELAVVAGGLGGLTSHLVQSFRPPPVTDVVVPDFRVPDGTVIRPGVEVLPDGTIIVDSTGVEPQLLLGEPHPTDIGPASDLLNPNGDLITLPGRGADPNAALAVDPNATVPPDPNATVPGEEDLVPYGAVPNPDVPLQNYAPLDLTQYTESPKRPVRGVGSTKTILIGPGGEEFLAKQQRTTWVNGATPHPIPLDGQPRWAKGVDIVGNDLLGVRTPHIDLISYGGENGWIQSMDSFGPVMDAATFNHLHPDAWNAFEATPQYHQQMSDIMAMNYVVGAMDFKADNVLVQLDAQGKPIGLIPIDGDYSFPNTSNWSTFHGRWGGFPNQYTHHMYERLLYLHDHPADLENALRTTLSPSEISATMDRINAILADIQAKIAEFGQGAFFPGS